MKILTKLQFNKYSKRIFTFFSFSILMLLTNQILASETSHDKHHFVGLFIGVLDADESDSVLGIEYEYKFNVWLLS